MIPLPLFVALLAWLGLSLPLALFIGALLHDAQRRRPSRPTAPPP